MSVEYIIHFGVINLLILLILVLLIYTIYKNDFCINNNVVSLEQPQSYILNIDYPPPYILNINKDHTDIITIVQPPAYSC